MSLLLAAALASATTTLPSCSWDRPGHNPFMGDVVAAVDRYRDIPLPVREKLKARMAARQFDEIVVIGRDSIKGKARYSSQITDMHFGTGQVCGTVSRAQWSSVSQERGLVYCESGHCILVPTVCRNVSRVQREDQAVAGAVGDDADPGAAGAGSAPAAAAAPAPAVAPNAPPAAASNAPGSFAEGAGLAPTPGTTAAVPAAEAGQPGVSLGSGGAGAGGAAPTSGTGGFAGLAGPVIGGAIFPAAPVDGGSLPAAATPDPVSPVQPPTVPITLPGVPVMDSPLPAPPLQPPDPILPTAPVPEPASWLLLALGLTGLRLFKRRSGRR